MDPSGFSHFAVPLKRPAHEITPRTPPSRFFKCVRAQCDRIFSIRPITQATYHRRTTVGEATDASRQ